MKFKKLLILLPLLALGLVGCGAETCDCDSEPVEPIDPTPTDPDPDPEEPVVTVDGQEEALKNLKALESVTVDGLYTTTYRYYPGTASEFDSSYYYNYDGIYTTEYSWRYYEYHGASLSNSYYSYEYLYVNYNGLCATEGLSRYNEVEYEIRTDSTTGDEVKYEDAYYQPFSYVTADNTTWDEDTLTLTINVAYVEDSLGVYKELFLNGMSSLTSLDVVFDEDYQPVLLTFEESTSYSSYDYLRVYEGSFVTLSELEDKVSRAVPYDTYDEIGGLQEILNALKNANNYTIGHVDFPQYIGGYLDKEQGVLQFHYEDDNFYGGTIKVEDNKYATISGINYYTGALKATSGKMTGNAYDAYFQGGSSAITPDYDVAAEFFQYEGQDTSGNPIYGIREDAGTSIYPYVLPAYPLIEQTYGTGGSFLNGYENVLDEDTGQYVDKYYHLTISGTTERITMSFSYKYGSTIYNDSITFYNLNSTTIPYTNVEYPTSWTELLGDIDNFDLALNAQNENGTLSFDDDVPFALLDDYTWSSSYSSVSYTAVDLYIPTATLSEAKGLVDQLRTTILAGGFTETSSNDGETDYYYIFKNTDETVGLKVRAWQYGSYYYLDYYAYGLSGNFQTFVNNAFDPIDIWYYEYKYNFSVSMNTIGSVFPYVNPPAGYFNLSMLYSYTTDGYIYHWSLLTGYAYSTTELQVCLDELYEAIDGVYADYGWYVDEVAYSSITYYEWSYDDIGDGITYKLETTWSYSSYGYYAVYLMFSQETA